MKGLYILLLLSSVVLFCSTAPALEPVMCSEDSGAAAAHLAMHHINEQHDHGYKFRLNKIQGIKVAKVDAGCDVELQLNLLETKCSVFIPDHFEDCEIREETQRAVMANCTVMMTVKNDDAKVTKYECDTRQVKTDMEMVMICPDCPKLIPFHSPAGMKSVDEAVKIFNQNTTNQRYYTLQEVGRILTGYVMMTGMMYYAEIALVETHCPMGSRIVLEACKPLCPDRAYHALCRTSYSSANGIESVECDFYRPLNTTALGSGEQEPACGPPHHVGPPHIGGRGPPPYAGGQGPPPHAGGRRPPPHAGGPPPGHHDPPFIGPPTQHHGPPFISHHPLQHFHPCRFSNLTSFDPALHPICPWPHPEPRPHPRQT